jgi:hypothetical protein
MSNGTIQLRLLTFLLPTPMSVLDYWLLCLAVQTEYTPLKKKSMVNMCSASRHLLLSFFFDKLLLDFESGEAWRIGDADADE